MVRKLIIIDAKLPVNQTTMRMTSMAGSIKDT